MELMIEKNRSRRFGRGEPKPVPFYAIIWGNPPGVYEGKEEAKRHYTSVPLAVYQAFHTREQAEAAYQLVLRRDGVRHVVTRGPKYRKIVRPDPPLARVDYSLPFLASQFLPSRGYAVVFRGLQTGVYGGLENFGAWYVLLCCHGSVADHSQARYIQVRYRHRTSLVQRLPD